MTNKIIGWGLVLALCWALGACVKASSRADGVARYVRDNYCGVYEGVLPAADGPGIRTRLSLHKDGAFTLKEEYIDRDFTAEDRGRFSVQGDIVTAVGTDGRRLYYRMDGKSARQLDAGKKPVAGPLASRYTLMRVK